MMDGWKSWVRDLVVQRIANVIRFAQVTLNTASGDGDAVQGNQTTEDEAAGGYQYTVRRLWPFGIRSRPPAGVDAIVVHAFGGSTNGVMVGAESPEYGPDDLQEGEVAIYAKKDGALFKIDVDGKITITAPSPAPVEINGDTVDINATAVEVGPNPVLAVLVQGAFDSMGVPITQAPASLSTLKSS